MNWYFCAVIIKSASFVVSNTDPARCPDSDKPEFAFIGRSNVGKSSLINMLVNRKNLAKTSSTPGKTQTINHFLINEKWFLVDLPGYGYASVAKGVKGKWGLMIERYLQERAHLMSTFVLLDPRVEPQAIDQEFIRWLGTEGIPFSIIFTKTDKLSRNQLHKAVQAWKEILLKEWEELPPIFMTSSQEHSGRKELLDYLEKALTQHNQ